MASAKRKQDEKNLKTLRELVSQSGNRECFDCRQRGPTYVNMTIGSFVCTSCSGMLRGLTPPHRVKSISMATFTQDEIKFLRERGNDYCRKTWLGLLNNRNPIDFDTTDEQGMKDHMMQKYDFKRYYLEPMIAAEVSDNSEDEPVLNNQLTTKQQQTSRSNANIIQTKAIPRVPNPASVQAKNRTKTEPAFVPDFVADFSKVPDPFSIASPIKSTPIQPQPSFANFDNNPIFNNVKNAETLQFDNNKSAFLSSNLNGVNAPPPEDRYAALKDLDSLMKQTQLKEDNLPKSTWNSNANGPNVNWGSNNTGNVISNPFVSGDLWKPASNFVNNNMQPMDNSFCTNPFRPTHFPMNNDSLWSPRESQNNEDVISSSQLMTSLSGKTWQPSVTAYHANPFMVGSGVGDMSRNSNNPFL